MELITAKQRWPIRLFASALVVAIALPQKQALAQVDHASRLPMLTAAQRLTGLSTVWRQVKDNFVYSTQMERSKWDSAFIALIPRVERNQSTQSYYALLERYIASLQDGHSNVFYPPEAYKSARYFETPWIMLEAIEGRAIVANVGTALAMQVPVGSEIVSVDGIDVGVKVERDILPYVSASTASTRWNWSIVGTADAGLLYGPEGSRVKVLIQTPKGERRSVVLMRDRHERTDKWLLSTSTRSAVELRETDGIAYLALNTFAVDSVASIVDRLMPQLLRARGLIIDLRHNGGGDSRIAFELLTRYFTSDTLVPATSRSRIHSGLYEAYQHYGLPQPNEWASQHGFVVDSGGYFWVSSPVERLVPDPNTPKITAPILVLIGPNTASAAEDFVVAIAGSKHFTLMGEPTAGTTGQPLPFDLPGGGSGRVCTKNDRFADGREFVGQGVQPQIKAVLTVEDVQQHRDTPLKQALALLRNSVRDGA